MRKHVKHMRFILVGTKKDLSTDNATLRRLSQEGQKPVQKADGRAAAGKMKATRYLECSAMQQDGVNEIFDQALQCALAPKKRKGCILL
jgi:GTPase SAR1 family protein